MQRYDEDQGRLLNTLRLLYVEDDEEARQELALYLKKRVASLAVAANGVEALALCRTQHFDGILCDLWMPAMDGFAFIRTLRQEGISTPVVITSAFSDSETILKAVDLGIVKYCVKPVDSVELLGTLCRIALERLNDAGELVLSGSRLLDRSQRLEAEKALKAGYAHWLKNTIGKGPKEVHAVLCPEHLDLKATETQTLLEQSLLQGEGGGGLAVYVREQVYQAHRLALEAVVSEVLQTEAALESVRISPQEGSDWVRFRLR